MLPILLSLGPINIYSYGVFLVLGVLLGTYVAWKKISEYHLEPYSFFDVVISVLLWGFVGARLTYVLTHLNVFLENMVRVILVFNYPGLSLIGGLVGGIATVYWWSRSSKERFVWFDLAAIGGVMGLCVVRIGAMLNGVGKAMVSNGWWGIRLVSQSEKVFPVWAVEAVALFIVFLLLWKWERQYRTFDWYRAGKSYAKTGFLFFAGLLMVGIIFEASNFLYLREGIEKWVEIVWPGVAIVAGLVGLYVRSGRSFETDLGVILGNKRSV